MQTLWTRALQAKCTCRCPQCSSPQSAVSRRVTTAPLRRRLQYGDAITVFYSTIIATAAVADASWKNAKSDELDAAIAHAKNELRSLDESQQQRLQALGQRTQSNDPTSRVSNKEESEISMRNRPLDTLDAYSPWRTPATKSLDQVLDKRSEVPFDSAALKGATSDSNPQSTNELNLSGPSTSSLVSRIAKTELEHKIEKARRKDAERTDSLGATGSYQSKSFTNVTDAKDRQYSASDSRLERTSRHDFYTALLKSDAERHVLGRTSAQLWRARATHTLTPYALARRNTAIAKMIYRFLAYALEISTSGEVEFNMAANGKLVLTRAHKPELDSKIQMLTARTLTLIGFQTDQDAISVLTPLPFPNYKPLDSNHWDKELSRIHALNSKLSQILSDTIHSQELFSRICHVLLTYDVVPNVHTFNILIIRLCHLQHYGAVDAVIGAMLECGTVQNEVTVAALLRYHTFTQDPKSFQALVNRMNVVAGHGVIPIQKDTKHLPQMYPGLLSKPFYRSRFYITSRSNEGRRLVRFLRLPRNQEIYDALIIGYLELGLIRPAMLEFSNMGRNGLESNSAILGALLRYCVWQKDWELGQSTWQRIKQMFARTTLPKPLIMELYYWMLQLCAFCDEKRLFTVVCTEGFDQGYLRKRLRLEDFMLETNYRILEKGPVDPRRALESLKRRAGEIFRLTQNISIDLFEGAMETTSNIDEQIGDGVARTRLAPNLEMFLAERLSNLYQRHTMKYGFYPDISIKGHEQHRTDHHLWISKDKIPQGSHNSKSHIGETTMRYVQMARRLERDSAQYRVLASALTSRDEPAKHEYVGVTIKEYRMGGALPPLPVRSKRASTRLVVVY